MGKSKKTYLNSQIRIFFRAFHITFVFLISLWLSGCIAGGNHQTEDLYSVNPPRKIDLSGFDGQKAYENITHQMEFGVRTPGSKAHELTGDWIQEKLIDYGWESELIEGEIHGYPIRNIVGKLGSGFPWIILGAHYDTRLYADKDLDPAKRSMPVPGANDGASGVALLLELARVLPGSFQGEIWMVYFDAEDNGNIDGRDWAMGSRYFVSTLGEKPELMILVDMIADQELQIYMEENSTESLMSEIWEEAAKLGYSEYFIPRYKYSIIDDHLPFIQAGIPAVDIIDFDYAYHHTTEDTLNKVSAMSLQIVGETLLSWITTNRNWEY